MFCFFSLNEFPTCQTMFFFLFRNEFNLWSELEISGEDAGRWLAQYYFSEHFKKQILSFNIHLKLSSIVSFYSY